MTYTFDELLALITQRGVHAEFGAAGESWGIEQSPYELAVFLVRMQELGIESVLEIGTGYKGGLSRFLAADMGWRVTTVDVVKYEHKYEGVTYIHYANDVIAPSFEPPDLVFIDGNHEYEHVKDDHKVWGYYAKKAVAFHDVKGLRGCEGAQEFWIELSVKHFMSYMVADRYKPAGIGWIEL